ncbi:hypothetical protein OG455_41825 [Kitasatospora sp. NBC_01287]|uniref:hypothetical protein n=1 Tax=Kitasatospora sp. NBC_01287 TaxID=2903573 RepID=UPI00224EE1D0|nr:hypothetical protein [Kitasatospora sp. NBC_01287]MCX4751724.1 hypothetical protein [Kitasatospora sp. NBC_01287]MCX4751984.1 hypothetical protein [Kitasatospora sp. NBC_01287]
MSEPRLLDWRDRSHWAAKPLPCQYCGGPTHLRDNQRHPSHKVCAEQASNDRTPE